MPNEWRTHPQLQGRFAEEFPDDTQVIAHDGGPRLTDHQPELVWVTVTAVDGDVFTGTLLNQPEELVSVAEGDTIRFVVPNWEGYPLMVTEKYLHERGAWRVEPCQNCGLDVLFDAPSDLVEATFSALPEDAELEKFTVICGFCGGVQVVERRKVVIGLGR